MTTGVAYERVKDALREHGSQRNGRGDWQCQAHDDSNPSLSVSQGERGAVVHCHAGCTVNEVVAALGLEVGDLFDEEPQKPNGKDRSPPKSRQAVANYVYTDRMGEPLARKVRYEPKTFAWEVADGSGWRAAQRGEGNPGVLYRVPEIIEADHVHINEGEKAADALAEAGHCATCPPTGRWTPELVEPLRGKAVTVWVDRDDEGQKKARKAIDVLVPVVKSLRIVHSTVETEKADAFDHVKAGYAIDQAVELDPVSLEERKPRPDIRAIAFSGDRLTDLLNRPKPDPVLAGNPVQGHLNLVLAPPMSGKSTLTYWNGMARAGGVAPWENVPARPAGRVLIYSIDESVETAVRRMNGLATFHPAGPLPRYAHNLFVIGPDREIDPDALEPLRFDEGGLDLLVRSLESADAAGEPFSEVYVDAYADVLPLGESENSNEEATRIGGALERIAVRFGCAIVLLHHTGKPRADSGEELPDVRFMGRGASALGAKARVITSIEKVSGLPHLRRLRTVTNLSQAPKPALFEVCPSETDTEQLLYFRPHDPMAAFNLDDLVSAGEAISTTTLAWRLSGKDPESGKSPPGETKRIAAQLRERWRRDGRIDVYEGDRKAKMIRRAEVSK